MNHVDVGRIALLFLLQVPIGGLLGGGIASMSGPVVVKVKSLSYPVERIITRRWPEPTERQVRRAYTGFGAAFGVPLQLSLGTIYVTGDGPNAQFEGMIGVVLLLAVIVLIVALRVGPPPNGSKLRLGISWSALSIVQTLVFGLFGWWLFVISAFGVGVFRFG